MNTLTPKVSLLEFRLMPTLIAFHAMGTMNKESSAFCFECKNGRLSHNALRQMSFKFAYEKQTLKHF